MSDEFISEDDLDTFDGWLKYQAIDLEGLDSSEVAMVREAFDDALNRRQTLEKIGRMKLKAQAGEYRYAVAIRDGQDLWLALWVRISPKGEVFVFMPGRGRDWDPHTSLHKSGDYHHKSHGKKVMSQKRQAPGSIVGSESMGAYGGYGPKLGGVVCDPQDFTHVLQAPPRILGPKNGSVLIDLLEPGTASPPWPGEEVAGQLFTDATPHVLIRIFR